MRNALIRIVSAFGVTASLVLPLAASALSFEDIISEAPAISVPQPDLIVSGVSFDAARIPTVTIKNQGNGATLFGIYIVASWVSGDGTVLQPTIAALSCTPILTAGASQSCALPVPPAPGATKLRVAVNPQGQVPNFINESDTGNNSWEGDVPPEPKPDLTVTSATFEPETRVATVTVKNQGEAPTLLGAMISVRWLNSSGAGIGSSVILPCAIVLTQNTSANCVLPPPPNNAKKLKLKINPDNLINETNFDNNSLTVNVPAQILPDLVITSISIDVFTRIPVITIKNQGVAHFRSVTIPMSWHTLLRDSSNAELMADEAIYPPPICPDGSLIALPPGGTTTCTTNVPLSNNVATYRVWTNTVKTNGVFTNPIQESSATNNAKSVTVPLPPNPDLVITSIDINVDNRIPVPHIKNQGNKQLDMSSIGMAFAAMITDSANHELVATQLAYIPIEYGCAITSGSAMLMPNDEAICTPQNGITLPSNAKKIKMFVNTVNNLGVIMHPYAESNYNNNSLKVNVPLPKLPDVVILGVSFDLDARVPVVNLKNQGNKAFDSVTGLGTYFAVTMRDAANQELTATGAAYASDAYKCENAAGSGLMQPGELFTCVKQGMGALPNNVKKIKYTVNSLKVGNAITHPIEESVYGNNSRTFNVPPPKLPDIAVTGVTFDDDARVPIVNLKNQGNKALDTTSGLGTHFVVSMKNAGNQELVATSAAYASDAYKCENATGSGLIQPSESFTCVKQGMGQLPTSVKKIKYTVNSLKVGTAITHPIEESVYNNNSYTFTVPPPKLPDIKITGVSFDAVGRIPTVNLKNQGNKALDTTSGLGTHFTVTMWDAQNQELVATGAAYASDAYKCDNATGGGLMQPGETFTCVKQGMGALPENVKRIKYIVNEIKVGPTVGHPIEESVYTNNSFTFEVPVQIVVLKSLMLTAPKKNIEAGSSITMMLAATGSDDKPMAVPNSALWIMSPAGLGTLANGTFVSNGTPGIVTFTASIGDISSNQLSITIDAKIVPGMAIQGVNHAQAGGNITFKAILTDTSGKTSQSTSGIWSVKGIGGTITQEGVYTAPANAIGRDTVTYTYTDEESTWREVNFSVLVEPLLESLH